MGRHRPRQPAGDDDGGLRRFAVRYRHDGADWTFELAARDVDDARTRLAALAEARLAVDEDAANAGPLAQFGHFLRHGLNRLFAINF